MDIIKNIIQELRGLNAKFSVVEDNLKIDAPKGAIDERLKLLIKTNKKSLIAYIEQVRKNNFTAIPVLPVQPDYALSSAQQRLWILSQIETGNVAYNMCSVVELKGALNKEALEHSFKKLMERHEILRTVFNENAAGEIRQHILNSEEIDFKIAYHDVRAANDQGLAVKALVAETFQSPFDLSKGPLLRARIYQTGKKQWVFTYVMHHIISDGWSMNILINELFDRYTRYEQGDFGDQLPLRIQYKEYAAWQQEQLNSEALAVHKAYWLKQLEGEVPVLQLPTDKVRPGVKTYNGRLIKRGLDNKLTNRLKQLSQSEGGTLFTGLLSVINTLLYRYTNQEDIIIGSPIAGREHADLEDQIGFYVNTLALRNRFQGSDTFIELLRKVNAVTLEAYEHQSYPFDALVEDLNLHRDISRSALFDVMVVLQNAGNYEVAGRKMGGVEIAVYTEEEHLSSKFDLLFSFVESEQELQLSIEYNSDLYTSSTMDRLGSHLDQLLAAIIESPEVAILELNYLKEEEQAELLYDFNETKAAYPDDKTIIDLFETQAEKTPDNIALVFSEKTFTYKELNEKANQLGAYLRKRYKISAGELIGIKLDRNEWQVLSILGILKSGGAYVPIDPDYPQERIAYLIADSSCKTILDEEAIEKFRKEQEKYTKKNLKSISKPDDLAYVMYTSGSTGQPKGVMVEQKSVIRLVKATNYIHITETDKILSLSNFSFDGSVFDIFASLLNGAALIIQPKNLFLDFQVLDKLIVEEGISVFFVTTALFNAWTDARLSNLNKLRYVLFGGEQVSLNHVRKFKALYGSFNLMHVYGPTENTTFSSYYPVREVEASSYTLPIGYPIANTQIYITGNKQELVPIGVIGEIHLGGDGLARGYLNQPDLTQEKFITNPFRQGERIYKTGDLGRWLADGSIEFIGRSDHQVKIRGHRIEPGEIENALQNHPSIDASIVVTTTNAVAEKELVAYFVSKESLNIADIRYYLSTTLPAYMLPDHFIQLDTLPLNANGKVDRKKLPTPEGAGISTGVVYIAPRNSIEEKLVTIWKQLLGRETIGVKDNFFELGGHSLKTIRLESQIHKEFDVKLSLKELFTTPLLEHQATLIQHAGKNNFTAIPVLPVQPDYALSSAQQRLWILSQIETGNVAYNMCSVVELKGALNKEALEHSFKKLMERHEILRTVFNENAAGEIRQHILNSEEIDFKIAYHDVRAANDQGLAVKALVAEIFQSPFDLSKGPLLRAGIYQTGKKQWVFTYVMHHIISDGWSMNILINELFDRYTRYEQGDFGDQFPLRIQYKEYAAWQQEQLNSEALAVHKAYWLKQLEGEVPVLQLPTDKVRPGVKTYNGRLIKRGLDNKLTNRLKQLSQSEGGTLFTGLLSVINTLLYRYTNQEDIIIGSPIAGREHADLEDQIGFYVNTLALRNRFQGSDTFIELLRKVNAVTLEAYEHQSYPFDALVEDLNLHRDISRSALFDVMVVLQNAGNYEVAGRKMGGVEIAVYTEEEHLSSKFDLLFSFVESEQELQLSIEYNSDLYTSSTMDRLGSHLDQLLAAIIESPEVAILELNYLKEEEQAELLYDFNETKAAYPDDKTIIDLFEAQVEKTPDNIALVFSEKTFTYKELNEKANQFARFIQDTTGVKEGACIAVLLERSAWSVISMISTMKLGCIYVPIDASLPVSRIRYMLEDSGSKLVITDDQQEISLVNYPKKWSRVKIAPDLKGIVTSNLKVNIRGAQSSFIIYTSGSTGHPKGVEQTHLTLYNLILWDIHGAQFNTCQKHLQFSSFSFDSSLHDIYYTLATGGEIHVINEALRKDLWSLKDYILERKMAVLSMPYAALKAMFNEIPIEEFKGHSVQEIISTGEQLYINGGLRKFLESNASITLYNLYGPSETHVVTGVSYRFSDGELPEKASIGKPVHNTFIYILDSNMQPVPIGIEGEIYIGGWNLARGYTGRPDLTQEKFRKDPFRKGELIYRSGDIGKWLQDGTIEYIMRKDHQLKINGYRVELGEIESALQTHELIESVVVTAKSTADEELELVAYIVSKQAFTTSAIRSYLSDLLPAYMIPAHFVQLDALPLTSNGKLDRKNLPDPDGLGMKTGAVYIAPANETEAILVSIWKQLLGKEKIGVKDNFFDLGGNSLKVVKMIGMINKAFNKKIAVVTAFKFPNIQSLAEHIHSHSKSEKEKPQEQMEELHAPQTAGEIAIVGIACRLPGARNWREYWNNLVNGVESVHFFSDQELAELGIDEKTSKQANFVRAKADFKNKDLFDSSFFEYRPIEAALMNPVHRIFHECIWESLEDAGINPEQTKGSIGLYVGAGDDLNWRVYSTLRNNVQEDIDDFSLSFINNKDYLASLLSYKLNLKGPSFSVNTACSTSLVAINLACKSLLSGETKIALAGGASIATHKQKGYFYEEGMIYSSDGHCKTFDKDASGTVRGEGAGIVVLKRLSDALKDGDQIYAVIKGSAINNDGNRKVGFTAPSVEGQIACIKKAQQLAAVEPQTISYVEAHGTATRLGDPIEVEALNSVFNGNKEQSCALGSVKTNIGHTDSAAGVAGLIKVALSLNYKKLPPSLHYKEPNPEIDFKGGPFYVNAALKEWQCKDELPLRAGVSSFGIGGTNAHAILEEAPEQNQNDAGRVYKLLTLSAKTESSLGRYIDDLKIFLQQQATVDLADMSYTYQVGRKSFLYRKSIAYRDKKELAGILDSGKLKKQFIKGQDENAPLVLVFMFSGQGSQYEDMGKDLYESEAIFRKEMDKGFSVMEQLTGASMKPILFPGTKGLNTINETRYAQPLIFLLEYALARLLMSWGIQPQYMIGHSIGEYTAACLSGVFSFEDALRLVLKRGELMNRLPKGTMLSVAMKEQDAKPFLTDGVCLAAVNSPEQVVLSGEPAAMEELVKKLNELKIPVTPLHTSHAFHSAMLDPMMDEFKTELEKVSFHPLQHPFISNLTGSFIKEEEASSPHYWVRHMRETVRFSDGIKKLLLVKPELAFIEIGAGASLTSLLKRQQGDNSNVLVFNLIRPFKETENDARYLAERIGQLWAHGANVDWNGYYKEQKRRKISLPTYSFEPIRYPAEIDAYEMLSEQGLVNDTKKKPNVNDWFYRIQWKQGVWLPGKKTLKEDSTVLIFSDELGLADGLITRLEKTSTNYVVVMKGNAFEKKNKTVYSVNPLDEKDFEQLFEQLRSNAILPTHLFHLWNFQTPAAGELQQKTAYQSLLKIARSFSLHFVSDQLDIAVIGKGWYNVLGNELLYPLNAISLGAVKVIPIEFQQLSCRAIDIVDLSEGSLNALFTELNYSSDVMETAIRGRAKYIKGFEKIDFEIPEAYASFKTQGTYIITGANGEMGKIFSEFLSDKFKANLILIDVTEEQPDFIRNLKSKGSEIIVIREDISAADKIRDQIELAEKKLGAIRGVIHTAAFAGGAGMILKRDSTADEKIVAPKIEATNVLNSILKNKALDFFVNCSTLSASVASMGQVATVAAAIYQDAFAESADSSYPVISIEWPDVNAGDHQRLTPSEIIQVVSRALYLKIPMQVISTVDLQQVFKNQGLNFKNLKREEVSSISNPVHERPALSTEFILPHTETEKKVTQILENFFGIKAIGSEDNFFELGADSLNIMKMTGLINKTFDEKIPVVTVYKFPTIQTLSEYIDSNKKTDVSESDEEMETAVSIMEGTFSLLNQHEDEE